MMCKDKNVSILVSTYLKVKPGWIISENRENNLQKIRIVMIVEHHLKLIEMAKLFLASSYSAPHAAVSMTGNRYNGTLQNDTRVLLCITKSDNMKRFLHILKMNCI